MEDKILRALKKVIDPELGINIVDLGLIYKVGQKDGVANILMTLTSPGCP
ncbi:MAG TPA: DNA methyltransferase, partial [Candidatus Blackburnbacteria bacterium]|nr:DNA methyltransferase [Candidatus Blackburnbacteria bacterium]